MRYKAKMRVQDRETGFTINAGDIVNVMQIIDQQNPCVFIKTSSMKATESAPISLTVFMFAFEAA